MPLNRPSLARALESVLKGQPQTSAAAAADWARAYLAYASAAASSAGSLPTNAAANLGILVGAFTAAFNSLSGAAAGALLAQGVMGYWQAIAWLGPTASGVTTVPGNLTLAASLISVFLDLSGKSMGDKAGALADAFDTGAKAVVVTDVPFVQPAPPIVGPIQ